MTRYAAPGLVELPTSLPNQGSFNSHPKALAQWIENLPMANLAEASRQLLDAMRQVNGVQTPPVDRIEFLEAMRPPIRTMVEGLRKQYAHRELPLGENARGVADVVMALFADLAQGYEIALESSLVDDGSALTRKRLALAVQRAIRHTGWRMVEGYLIYEPGSAADWHALNTLYRFSEDADLADVPVADDTLEHGKVQTAAGAYKQILLTAAAGPYRMPKVEVLAVYALLERWAPRITLPAASADTSAEGVYMIDLNGNRPPFSRANGDQQDPRILRTIATTDLPALINREMKEPGLLERLVRRREQRTDGELLQRIVIALGVTPKRRFPRQSSGAQAEVALGLSQIHRLLSQHQGDAYNTPENQSRFQGRDLSVDRKQDDVWELVYPEQLIRALQWEDELRKHRTKPTIAEPKQDATDTREWHLVNVSAGGYCLLSDPSHSGRTQVNELVLIREVGDSSALPWQIGVVRWMKNVPDTGLQVGVQLLAPSPVAVTVSATTEQGRPVTAVRGLILPRIAAIEQPATLVTPSLPYALRGHADIHCAGRNYKVKLEHRLEESNIFCRFEIRAAESSVEMPTAALESIWSLV